MNSKEESLKSRARNYYIQNETRINAWFFILGFLFDVATLSRIDDIYSIGQQLIYLFLIMILLIEEERPSDWSKKISHLKEPACHFLLGSLISVYSLFYFKSSSFAASFIFLAVVFGLLVANEIPRFQGIGSSIRWGLWSLCVMSFFAILYPIALGFLGKIPNLLALFTSLALLYAVDRRLHFKRTFAFSYAVPLLYFLLYIFKQVPPVPLSLSEIGVYHSLEKKEQSYLLGQEKPWWKFWQSGDQNFSYKEGDRVYVYFALFSPTRFADDVFLDWYYKNPKGIWEKTDHIPIQVKGGRDLGYRGFTYKSKVLEGDWQARVMSSDDREIGRIGFDVYNVPADYERTLEIVKRD